MSNDDKMKQGNRFTANDGRLPSKMTLSDSVDKPPTDVQVSRAIAPRRMTTSPSDFHSGRIPAGMTPTKPNKPEVSPEPAKVDQKPKE